MKKLKKIQNDLLVDEVKKLTEAVNALRDRTRNDSFMLTHNSQEIQKVQQELTYVADKVKVVTRNPFVKVGHFVNNFASRYGHVIEIGLIGALIVMAFLLGRKL